MAYALHRTRLHPSGNDIDPSTLESRVRHDFAGPEPHPTVVLPQTAPAPFTHYIPSLTTHVSLLKYAPIIPSPPIAYPSSLDLSLLPPWTSRPGSPAPVILSSPLDTTTQLNCVVFSFSISSLAPMSPPLAPPSTTPPTPG
jgi:hypothetical protein